MAHLVLNGMRRYVHVDKLQPFDQQNELQQTRNVHHATIRCS